MLVFSTRIPLKETTTRDDFLDVCIRWVVGSPRYVTEGLIYNALNQEDYDYSNDNITFSILFSSFIQRKKLLTVLTPPLLILLF